VSIRLASDLPRVKRFKGPLADELRVLSRSKPSQLKEHSGIPVAEPIVAGEKTEYCFTESSTTADEKAGGRPLLESSDQLVPAETNAQPPTVIPAQKSRWIVSELFDLLFVCGFAPWILGLAAYLVFGATPVPPVVPGEMVQAATSLPTEPGSASQAFSLAFVVASLIIGESHQFTSIIRYFTVIRNRKKSYLLSRLPFWFLYAAVISAIAVHFDSSLTSTAPISWWFRALSIVFSLGFTFFPVVLMQHICAQAKAVSMIYCGKQGFKLGFGERLALSITTWSLVIAGASTIAAPFGATDAGSELSAFLESVRLGAIGGALTFVSATVLYFVHRGFLRKEWLPVGTAAIWCNLAIWLLLPVKEMLFVWLCVPLFFHATQHWSVAWSVKRAELKADGVSLSKGRSVWEFFRMAIPIQAVTVLVLFLPLLAGEGTTGLSQTLSVELSIFVFYIHYFADRVVWRPQ